MKRVQIKIQGAVQGVGFRPFIYQLAKQLQLMGWVNNSAQGVMIEVEGQETLLETFIQRIHNEKPPHSIINKLETIRLPPENYKTFEIRQSSAGQKTTIVLPDLATCNVCLAEIFNPQNRRYRYPFTNCTHCGPRYTIIEALPYDRNTTTMKGFKMCPQCQLEYENPENRRFHAQPNACPTCGPHLEYWDQGGNIPSTHDGALLDTVQALKTGKIVAVKGLGGFHLMAAAHHTETVQTLRKRKHRPDKPFALMYPNLEQVFKDCYVSELEQELLQSSASPIVLLKHKRKLLGVAPNNPYFGVMLPYTPLHHLLMQELGFPVVATSGNFTNEPICIDEQEAVKRLSTIADAFLVHNRPIVRPVDDSIVREMGGKAVILRRARGYAPFPFALPEKEENGSILAVGAHLKNTVAVSLNSQVFLSQHIGDLETPQAFHFFEHTINSFEQLYEVFPHKVACDAHPDYLSTQYAKQRVYPPQPPLVRGEKSRESGVGGKLPPCPSAPLPPCPPSQGDSLKTISLIPVQHHLAHVFAGMSEHQLFAQRVLGVAYDGTGYGLDTTIWGGEFLLVEGGKWERVAHLQPFPLVGGDRAAKEPRRSALGLLYACFGEELWTNPTLQSYLESFTSQELSLLRQSLQRNVNTVLTSSAGRAFDGVSSLLKLCQKSTFEGQAAMQLEFAVTAETEAKYPVLITDETPMQITWKPLITALLADIPHISPGIIAAKFHNSLIAGITAIAQKIQPDAIMLTGGCFQNQYLSEKTVQQLQDLGLTPYTHGRIPPNDGCIALGQIAFLSQII